MLGAVNIVSLIAGWMSLTRERVVKVEQRTGRDEKGAPKTTKVTTLTRAARVWERSEAVAAGKESSSAPPTEKAIRNQESETSFFRHLISGSSSSSWEITLTVIIVQVAVLARRRWSVPLAAANLAADAGLLAVVAWGALDERLLNTRFLALLAEPVLRDEAGATIVADVKSSAALFDRVRALGGRPLMWRTGHSSIGAMMLEEGAPIAGELSGHVFFARGWYGFDDALLAALRTLRALGEIHHAPIAVAALGFRRADVAHPLDGFGMLVPRVELGPLSYGIYLYMQSAVGRGPGAALGVVAIVLVAAGTWAATALARRSGAALFRS